MRSPGRYKTLKELESPRAFRSGERWAQTCSSNIQACLAQPRRTASSSKRSRRYTLRTFQREQGLQWGVTLHGQEGSFLRETNAGCSIVNDRWEGLREDTPHSESRELEFFPLRRYTYAFMYLPPSFSPLCTLSLCGYTCIYRSRNFFSLCPKSLVVRVYTSA